MQSLIILIFLLVSAPAFSQYYGGNSVGGKFASQMSAATARVDDETAPFTNPAGLANVNVNSISSGASSYSAFKAQRDSENEITTSSSTSHVAYIQNYEKFNLGFMVYTNASSMNKKINSKRYKNSEGYDSYYYNYSEEKQNTLMYILAFAPKGSKWGFATNIYDLNYDFTVSRAEHEYYKTEFSNRSWSNQFTATQFKVKLASASVGYQDSYKNFRFGFKVESPAYLLSNDSHQTVDMMYIVPNMQNDTLVLSNNVDSDLEIQSSKFRPESITMGLAYLDNKFQYEFNLFIEAASMSHELNTEDPFMSYTWSSQTDDYTTQANIDDDDSSYEYSKALIVPSFGVQFKTTDAETFGSGISYIKNRNKDNSGVDSVLLSAGYAKSFKNFLGTYSLIYQKDFDSGGNYTYDYQKDRDIQIDLSKESLSLIFGGSYTF